MISIPVVSGTPVALSPGIVSITASGLAVWAAQAASMEPSARAREMRYRVPVRSLADGRMIAVAPSVEATLNVSGGSETRCAATSAGARPSREVSLNAVSTATPPRPDLVGSRFAMAGASASVRRAQDAGAGVAVGVGAPGAPDASGPVPAVDGRGVVPGTGGTVGAGPAQEAMSATMARNAGRAPVLRRVRTLPEGPVEGGYPCVIPPMVMLPVAAATWSARDPAM